MKTKTTKTFDAVTESRKWRETTSALLASMVPEVRQEFLNRRLARFRVSPVADAARSQDARD